MTTKKSPNLSRPRRKLPAGITIMRFESEGEMKQRYRVRIQYKGRATSAGLYETLGEAKTALKHYRHQVLVGTFVPARERHRRWNAERALQARQKVTVSEYAQRWMHALETGPVPRSPGTLVSYDSTLTRHILSPLGSVPLSNVTQKHVDRLLKVTEEESGPGAARNVARTLRTMFRHAVSSGAGGLTAMPFTVSTPKSKMKETQQVPVPTEVTRISAAMPGPIALAPLLSAVCALRPGEALGLQRQDFAGLDGEAPVLQVRRQWDQKMKPPQYSDPKAGSSRDVLIPQFLIPQIKEHLGSWVDDGDDSPVFPSTVDRSKPVSHTSYRGAWNKAQQDAQVGPFVLHSLRHLGLSLLAVVGATQAEVMARGGHRNLESAARYQHQLRGRDLELAAALGDKWEGK